MKIKVSVLLAAACAAAAPAVAAEYNNEVDVGILSLAVGNFNGRYERNLNDYFSAFAGAGFAPMGYIFVSFDEEDISWQYYNANAGAKFYPLGGFRALYIQAEVNAHFNHIENKSTGETGNVNSIVPAVLIGWRWVVAKRATLTLGAGSGYASGDIDAAGVSIDFEGIRPRVDFNLGFLF